MTLLDHIHLWVDLHLPLMFLGWLILLGIIVWIGLRGTQPKR
jgi:hypothetical protein